MKANLLENLTNDIKKVYFRYRNSRKYSFEFDEEKSASNLEKHGIDFLKAQELWQDRNVARTKLNTTSEERWRFVGQIDGKYFTAITTYRNKKIRIISIRRSRKNEVEEYESERNKNQNDSSGKTGCYV
jgi:uncharacterized DUF497 family protein